MATSSSRSSVSYHVRSVSFPSRSHSTTLRVEAQLNKIQTSATPSAEEICNNLSSLEELYKSMDALINLNETQQSGKQAVDELLDGSVRILDICGSIRDLVSQIKENVRDLQSALRRRKRDSNMESSITKYTSFQKKMKEAKRLISSLKEMENKTRGSTKLREVSAVANSIFQSILLFVCAPVVLKPKQSKWSLFSKSNNNKGEVECQIEIENVEGSIEEIENGLEGVFRKMVRTRASLLNAVSSSY